MFSRYRTASVMSTFLGVAAAAALLAGCPDPGARLDEFASRVPDAQVLPEGCPAPSGQPLPVLPDLSGNGLFALRIAFVPRPIQLYATYTMTRTGTGADLDIKLEFLKTSDRTIFGTPIMVNDVIVAPSGEFCFTIPTIEFPKEANPLNNDATAENLVAVGKITSNDFACGTVGGTVTRPIEQTLSGSTFGTQRVAPGTTGTALPDPISACP